MVIVGCIVLYMIHLGIEHSALSAVITMSLVTASIPFIALYITMQQMKKEKKKKPIDTSCDKCKMTKMKSYDLCWFCGYNPFQPLINNKRK